jgi:hypothetical protein
MRYPHRQPQRLSANCSQVAGETQLGGGLRLSPSLRYRTAPEDTSAGVSLRWSVETKRQSNLSQRVENARFRIERPAHQRVDRLERLDVPDLEPTEVPQPQPKPHTASRPRKNPENARRFVKNRNSHKQRYRATPSLPLAASATVLVRGRRGTRRMTTRSLVPFTVRFRKETADERTNQTAPNQHNRSQRDREDEICNKSVHVKKDTA